MGAADEHDHGQRPYHFRQFLGLYEPKWNGGSEAFWHVGRMCLARAKSSDFGSFADGEAGVKASCTQ